MKRDKKKQIGIEEDNIVYDQKKLRLYQPKSR